MIRELTLPLTRDEAASLRAGDLVTLTGPVYTARDAAHKRLIALMEEGKELPLPLLNQTLYYVGPSPAPPGLPIGSAGPTTSYRMDSYTPALLDAGLVGMIGKGARSPAVVEAMMAHVAICCAMSIAIVPDRAAVSTSPRGIYSSDTIIAACIRRVFLSMPKKP